MIILFAFLFPLYLNACLVFSPLDQQEEDLKKKLNLKPEENCIYLPQEMIDKANDKDLFEVSAKNFRLLEMAAINEQKRQKSLKLDNRTPLIAKKISSGSHKLFAAILSLKQLGMPQDIIREIITHIAYDGTIKITEKDIITLTPYLRMRGSINYIGSNQMPIINFMINQMPYIFQGRESRIIFDYVKFKIMKEY